MRGVLSAVKARAASLGRYLVGHLVALLRYPAVLVTTAGRAWRWFFFTPADPTPLGLIRIIVGVLSTWSLGTIGMDLQGNLGSNGWASPEALRDVWTEWEMAPWSWSLWLVIPDRLLTVAWSAAMLILILFTLGLASRVMAPLAWAIMASTSRRAPVLYFGFDQVMLSWLLYLMITGASGQALSLDRLLARRRGAAGSSAGTPPTPTVSANLALRLIQLNLCMIYAAAGLAKLKGTIWWTGDAALWILLAPEYRVNDLYWLAAYPRFLNFLTYATVAIEILYPVLVWVRVLRPLMVLGMILLHVGIDLTMGLTEFSLVMIAGNLAFVSGAWLRGPGHRPPSSYSSEKTSCSSHCA